MKRMALQTDCSTGDRVNYIVKPKHRRWLANEGVRLASAKLRRVLDAVMLAEREARYGERQAARSVLGSARSGADAPPLASAEDLPEDFGKLRLRK